MKKKKKIPARADLLKKGIPLLFIPGIILALKLGPKGLENLKNYSSSSKIFPSSGYIKEVEDADTFTLKDGTIVRLLGLDAPDRGEEGFQEAKNFLSSSINGQKIYLEYDRYQDDKYGRVLAWVWFACEATPTFTPPNYMHLSGNRSREQLTQNPAHCQRGILFNRELVKQGFAKPVSYDKRAPLKYPL